MSPSTDGGTDTALHAARAPTGGHHSGGGGPSNRPYNGGGGRGNRNKGKGPAAPPTGNAGGSNSSPRPPALPAPSTTPWTGMVHAWPVPWRPHAPGSGILGPRPGAPSPFAGTVSHYHGNGSGAPGIYHNPAPPGPPAPAWDQTALIQALNAMSVQQQQAPPNGGEWYLDTGATAHMASSSGMIASPRPSRSSRIVVGNGSSLAVTHTGHHCLPTTSNSLSLNNVLISPNLIKNLVSVKKLTRDNPVNVEFDDLGFSVKERRTKTVILRCESDGELYPITPPTTHHGFAAVTVDLWHQRLGHPGRDGLAPVLRVTEPASSTTPSHTCHACQLGKHTRLPFSDSQHISYFPFQLIHCDIWTSPVPSVSGLQYYLVILDDYSHFVWTFPLRATSDALLKIQNFQTFIRCHYNLSILNLQTDNGREFDNHASRTFFSAHGILLRMSCPYTSPQNGRAERILRTLNNTV